MIESVCKDLRYAARALGRNRLFAAAAIGALAVAIGANTAIFSLIDGAALRNLQERRGGVGVAVFDVFPVENV